jgi:transcriptional regulator with XRE-family HTH domain
MAPTFQEHMSMGQRHPAYWSYLTTLEFVDGIVAEMDRQGINGAELARRMGTSRAWVSRVLAGECNLTVASMGKLAFALGMKVTTQLAPADTSAAAPAESRETRQRRSA